MYCVLCTTKNVSNLSKHGKHIELKLDFKGVVYDWIWLSACLLNILWCCACVLWASESVFAVSTDKLFGRLVYESYILICCLTCYSLNVIHKQIRNPSHCSLGRWINTLTLEHKLILTHKRPDKMSLWCSLESIEPHQARIDIWPLNMHAQHELNIENLSQNRKIVDFLRPDDDGHRLTELANHTYQKSLK